MKKYIVYIVCILTFIWGCNSRDKKNDGDAQESHKEQNCDHDHSAEEHNHESHEDHDDHDHEAEEGNHEGHNHDHDKKSDEKAATHADEIIFTPAQAKAAGVEVITVATKQFNQVIKTSGQVLAAPGDEITLSATASGIVSFNKSSVSEGLAVRSGESLLAISSKRMIDGDPIAKSKAAYQIAQLDFQRAESLIKDRLISEKEYNEIKLNYESAKISYQASASNQTAKGTSIPSPISGYIKSKLVSEGQYVEVGQPLLTVTQNKKLQLRADVSERHYKDLKNISSANFKTSYDETVQQLSKLNGRLISFGKSASDNQFYIPVNFEFDNIGDVVSGSYVEIFLLGQARPNVISIPVSSLVEEQSLYSVYIQLDAEGYKKQMVKLGANDGDNVEILSGLKQGDRVVSKGAYNIKLASASASIPHGHEH